MLVIIAILYALCAALSAVQGWNPRGRIIIGEVLLPGFGYEAMVVFLALFLLSGYAGLAAIWRWRGWQFLVAAAAWVMLGLAAAIGWFLLYGGLIGLPVSSPAIGAAIAALLLFASGALTANEPGGLYFVRHWNRARKLATVARPPLEHDGLELNRFAVKPPTQNRENNPMQSRMGRGSQHLCCAAPGHEKKNGPSARPQPNLIRSGARHRLATASRRR
jgi:hypothetical protein